MVWRALALDEAGQRAEQPERRSPRFCLKDPLVFPEQALNSDNP
jgi:hypothetical protein